MATDQDPTDDDDSGAQISDGNFERMLRDATVGTVVDGLGPRSAFLPELRRALRSRVGRQAFDDGLRRLRDDRIVALEPHAHPRYLSPSDVEDALQDREGLLYLLRWIK